MVSLSIDGLPEVGSERLDTPRYEGADGCRTAPQDQTRSRPRAGPRSSGGRSLCAGAAEADRERRRCMAVDRWTLWTGDRLGFGRAARNPSFDGPAPEVVLRQVHHRSAEVSIERVGIPQVPEVPDHTDERILGDVLGYRTVSGEEVGQPDGARSGPLIEVGELARPRRSVGGSFTRGCLGDAVHDPTTPRTLAPLRQTVRPPPPGRTVARTTDRTGQADRLGTFTALHRGDFLRVHANIPRHGEGGRRARRPCMASNFCEFHTAVAGAAGRRDRIDRSCRSRFLQRRRGLTKRRSQRRPRTRLVAPAWGASGLRYSSIAPSPVIPRWCRPRSLSL